MSILLMGLWFVIGLCWGFVLHGWLNLWLKKKQNPYSCNCLVEGCSFKVSGNDWAAVIAFGENHRRAVHPGYENWGSE